MLKIKIIIIAVGFLFIQACGDSNVETGMLSQSPSESNLSENKLIAVKDASELVGTWIIKNSSLFIFTSDGYFDIRNIGSDNLNNLYKGYDTKYYISNEVLYTQSPNERVVKRGSPVYINKDRNIIYLYDDTNLEYHKIDMSAVLKNWDESFVRVTNASQILGSWIDELEISEYTFYKNGDCDMSSFKRKYEIDDGNIYFFEGNEGYGNRMAYLSKDGSALYFNLRTNNAYHRK